MADSPKPQPMPTPLSASVDGLSDAKLFKDGKFPIYILPDGRFAVKWGGLWKRCRTLKAAEKITSETKKSIQVFFSDHGDKPPQIIEAVAYENKRMIDKDGKRHHRVWYGQWLVYNATLFAKLEAVRKKVQEAEEKLEEAKHSYEVVVQKFQRVRQDNFTALVNGDPTDE